MRQAPLNYLITVAVGGLLWVVTAIFAGKQMGDSVVLQVMTTAQFTQTYQTVVAVAALTAVLGCLGWYFYGSRDTIAARLGDAKRTWTLLLVLQIVVAAIALVVLVLMFKNESLTAGNFIEMFALLALQTFVLFWVCTLLMSPRSVEFIPWGAKR